MTRSELDALKEKAKAHKYKAADMETLAEKLFGLLGSLAAVLPEDVKEVLRKYGQNVE